MWSSELRTGRLGMVHHLFEKKGDADKFLVFIRKVHAQFPDITRATITDPASHPDYQGESFFRIRISPAQFKFLAEACGELTSPTLAIPPTQKPR